MIVSRTGAVHVGGILFYQPLPRGVGLKTGRLLFLLTPKNENSPTA
jgi:hypothetical protein